MEREDLWCPFELDAQQLAHRTELARSAREAHVRYAALMASTTAEEKKGVELAMQSMPALAPGLQTGKPKPLPRKSMVSFEGMMASKPKPA
jgi:hypothetical protein